MSHQKAFHHLVSFAAFGALGISLIWFLAVWSRLPEPLGVHFSSTGEFDVYEAKWFGLYPHVVGFIILTLIQLIELLARKVKSGLHINAAGERAIQVSVGLLLDANQLCISTFFTYWSYCVITQSSLNTAVPVAVMRILLVAFLTCMARIVMIRLKHSSEESN